VLRILTAFLLVIPFLTACNRPQGLRVGQAFIPAKTLALAVQELRTTFPAQGEATCRWILLQEGMGPAAILHEQHPLQSAEAKKKAGALKGQLQQGTSMEDLCILHGQNSEPLQKQPTPFGLGARISAAVADMEPGEWRGPFLTLAGWEFVELIGRNPGLRSRSGVIVRTLVVAVGSYEDQKDARALWKTLPLSGNADILRTVPPDFSHGRLPE
jgi:hypothetical protein